MILNEEIIKQIKAKSGLNTIAMYLGYATWQKYTETNSIDSVWNFSEDETYHIQELAIGTNFCVEYLNRKVSFVVIQRDGINVLEVVSAKNSIAVR